MSSLSARGVVPPRLAVCGPDGDAFVLDVTALRERPRDWREMRHGGGDCVDVLEWYIGAGDSATIRISDLWRVVITLQKSGVGCGIYGCVLNMVREISYHIGCRKLSECLENQETTCSRAISCISQTSDSQGPYSVSNVGNLKWLVIGIPRRRWTGASSVIQWTVVYRRSSL